MRKSFSLKYSLSLLITFIVLAIFVGNSPINPLDLSISHHIQQVRNSWLDQLMIVVSRLGDVAFAFFFYVGCGFVIFYLSL